MQSETGFYFVDASYRVKTLIFGAGLSLLVSFLLFMQTDHFLKYTHYPSHEEIKNHIRASKVLQAQQKQAAANDPNRVRPKEPVDTVFFSNEKAEQVKKAREVVIKDQDLANVLKDKLEIADLDKVSAVFIPASEMKTMDNCTHAGIVHPIAWNELDNAKSEDPEGVTIRDRGPDQVRTLDGIPRVFLMAKAFQYAPKSLQRTVAHELLHAMNIPAYRVIITIPVIDYPVRVTRFQTDLSYLDEYRDYIRKAGLETWDQTIICGAMASFLAFFSTNVFALFRHYRRRRRVQ